MYEGPVQDLIDELGRLPGIGPKSAGKPDPVIGLSRGRAATTLMLSLPGSAYLYQGEEVGLPEVTNLPDDARQDPTCFRTGGETYGRDGCHVPLPWEADSPSYGFGPGGRSWLPRPAEWAELARDRQRGVPGSTLTFYRSLLTERRRLGLGGGDLRWLDGFPPHVLAFRNGDVTVLANTGTQAVPMPDGEVLLASDDLEDGMLPPDTTVWVTDVS